MRAAHADAPHSSTKDVISVFFCVSLFVLFFLIHLPKKTCPLVVRVSIRTDEPKVGWGESLGLQHKKGPNLSDLAMV